MSSQPTADAERPTAPAGQAEEAPAVAEAPAGAEAPAVAEAPAGQSGTAASAAAAEDPAGAGPGPAEAAADPAAADPAAADPAAAEPVSKLAVAALAAGVIALVPVAVACGIAALVGIRRTGRRGHGMAMAALSASAAWVIIGGAIGVVGALTHGFQKPISLAQSYVFPDEVAWAAGTRTVICEVRATSGELTGSVRGAT
jgi:hypothetical protein